MPSSIYIIAGEASGDFIGGALMDALTAAKPELHFHGIGGEWMHKHSFQSLFAMQELSMMGFMEVLPHIFRLKARIAETVADILEKQPDMLVTIDSPGFTFRVVKALRKQGFTKPCIHYVAPTVWAYKPKRAAKTAHLFDALMVLLPFEPPYFEKVGLKTHFVGHPVAWHWREKGDGGTFRAQHHIPADATVIGMMPGSRMGELKRHLPVFEHAVRLLPPQPYHIIMPVNESVKDAVYEHVKQWSIPVVLSDNKAEKKDAFAACDIALAKSGTIALETALAGIPTLTTFRANPISIWLIRRMIHIPYVNLLNIMAWFDGKQAPIPELIQEECHPKHLAKAMQSMLEDAEAQKTQRAACQEMFARLGMEDAMSPSEKASQVILQYV